MTRARSRFLRATAAIGIPLGLVLAATFSARREPRAPELSPPLAPAPTITQAMLDAAWSPPRAPSPSTTVTVFWEAERPLNTDYPSENPFAPADAREARALSAGAWIGAVTPGQGHFLEYDVSVSRDATYAFYARKFAQHGAFRYRFDDGRWNEVTEQALLDKQPVRKDVFVDWVYAGEARLSAGPHRVRIEVHADARGISAWDAFALGDDEQPPRGVPDEAQKSAPNGWFTFDPQQDPFAASALDLRGLNEASAGAGGFITVVGSELVHADTGVPIRFWGVNSTHKLLELPRPLVRYFARQLAKHGVNLLRLHGPPWSSTDLATIDAKKLDALQFLVSELKNNGIYTELSIYFPLWFKPRPEQGFDGYSGDQPAFSLLYFNPRFEAIYRGWWDQILTSDNPYAGVPLARDPAIALVELVNEDSTLFWTFRPYESLPAAQTVLAERAFADFAAERYGSLQQAFQRWGGAPVRGDSLAERRAGFLALDEILRARHRRARDTAEFLAVAMRRFYERSYRHLKDDLGFSAAVVCSNWQTADARVLGPLDKWANDACDVFDRHGYYGGPHVGPAASYAIRDGDRYGDASALRFDGENEDRSHKNFDLPILDVRYQGKPSLASEFNWVPPNRFRAEGPFLAAAYGSLQATNGFVFFAKDSYGYDEMLDKFGVGDPAIFGLFPAAALLYRKGYVTRGEPALRVELAEADVFALRGSPIAPAAALDALRAADVPSAARREQANAAPGEALASLIGRVDVSFGRETRIVEPAPLRAAFSGEPRPLASNTRELTWDYQRGLAVLDAPRAQGVTGFLGTRRDFAFGACRFETDLEYGTVLLVSLDGEPLTTSGKMLLEVMSEVENRDFKSEGAPLRTITDVGRPPLEVRALRGKLTFKRADVSALRATALDPNGYALREAKHLEQGLYLLPDALYYVITHDNSKPVK